MWLSFLGEVVSDNAEGLRDGHGHVGSIGGDGEEHPQRLASVQ